MTAPLPPSPKTSIFDRTHPGTEPPTLKAGVWSWFRRLRPRPGSRPEQLSGIEESPSQEPVRARLRRPSRIVALPTLPDPDPELAQLLEEALAEATGIPPEPPRPAAPLDAETRPVLLAPPQEGRDLTTRTLPPLRPPRGRRARWVAAGLAVACGVGLGLWALPPTSSRPSTSLPPEITALKARAEQGDVTSMRLLGLHYAYGLQVPADPAEAMHWLDKAAQAGSGSARQELAALRRTP